MSNRPDIILLVLDTQRADRLSCYGYERETTPAIDAFAAGATRFAAAVAPAQWTVPTHASLFTGLYPSQHTMHQMNSVLPGALPTLAQRLAAQGYHTVGFSQNPLIGLVKNDLDRGFQRFESYHLLSNILLTTRLNRPDAALAWRKRLECSVRWLMAESLGYSFETPLRRLAPLLAPLWQRLLHVQGRSKTASTAKLLRAAARLLVTREGCAPGQPVFLFVNLMGAHVPYDPDRRILQRFLPSTVEPGKISALLRWANHLQINVQNWLHEPLPATQTTLLNAIYDAEVATQDAQVGSFIQTLRDAQRFEQTVLAMVADHGDHLGDKERVNHAFGVYQALVHVPLIVCHPDKRLLPSGVRDEPVSTRRLFHTLLAAAGAATAEEESMSLAYADAVATHLPDADAVFSEGYPLQWAIGRLQQEKLQFAEAQGHLQTVRAVRQGQHKLIAASGWSKLYDLSADTREVHDLHTALPERARQLRRLLDRFQEAARPVAGAATHEEDDPEVLRQLRELGYLE